jgi:hypothetical protein
MAKLSLTVGTSVEKYVLMAVLAGIVAGITAWLGYTTASEAALVGALIAGLSAAFAQYSSTGSIPGTQIPITSLLQLGMGALLVVLEKYAGQTVWTTPTILAAVVLFLSTLLSEIQTETPSTRAGATPTPPAAGPPA